MKNNILFLVVEITRLLNNYNCCYKDTEEILKILNDEIKMQRDEIDMDVILEDKRYIFLNRHLSDNKIVKALNHVEPYC